MICLGILVGSGEPTDLDVSPRDESAREPVEIRRVDTVSVAVDELLLGGLLGGRI